MPKAGFVHANYMRWTHSNIVYLQNIITIFFSDMSKLQISANSILLALPIWREYESAWVEYESNFIRNSKSQPPPLPVLTYKGSRSCSLISAQNKNRHGDSPTSPTIEKLCLRSQNKPVCLPCPEHFTSPWAIRDPQRLSKSQPFHTRFPTAVTGRNIDSEFSCSGIIQQQTHTKFRFIFTPYSLSWKQFLLTLVTFGHLKILYHL